MKNLTKEQIERINDVFDSISGEGFTEEEIFEMYGEDNVEFVESEENSIGSNEIEEMSFEEKIDCIIEYYNCAGFDIQTEEDLFRFLNI